MSAAGEENKKPADQGSHINLKVKSQGQLQGNTEDRMVETPIKVELDYKFSSKEEIYCKGFVKSEGIWKECNFFRIKCNGPEYFRYTRLETISRVLHEKSLLIPEVVHKETCSLKKFHRPSNKCKFATIIGYRYKMLLSEWLAAGHCPPFFPQKSEIMDDWWRRQIKGIVNTLHEMHNVGVYHGLLSEENNYAITEQDELCILKPNWIYEPEQKKKRVYAAKTDLEDFFGFLFTLGSKIKSSSSEDWTLFQHNYKSLMFDKRWVLKHPVFNDNIANFEHLRDLIGRIRSHMDLPIKTWKHLVFRFRGSTLSWSKQIEKDSVYSEIYIQGKYDGTLFGLVEYLENVMKLVEVSKTKTEDVGRQKEEMLTKEDVAKEFNKMFKGVFSVIHQYCAEFCASENVQIIQEE